MQKKYHKPARPSSRRKAYTSSVKPGSDPKLKKVFSRIGVPEKKPFRPDPFQIEALEAIENADCLVTVPTGSGKTWIAEQVISRNLKARKKSWYASPLKALSNTIYNLFTEIFGPEQVGILTGDRKENPEAPIIVGTTEILRNQLYDSMHQGKDIATDFVILDEAHFLGDPDRGVVWEEVMIYLPPRIPLLMLSATIGNAGQIAGWLATIRSRECVIIEKSDRPVPLYPLFFHPSGTLYPLLIKQGVKKRPAIYKKVMSYINSDRPPLLAPPRKLPPMGKILRVLKKYRLLPAIFFMKSRADCDMATELCTEEILHQDPGRKEKLSRRIEELIRMHPHLARHKLLWNLENLAVGSHHSGQLPIWKEVVETLMSEGLLDAVFATSTVAAGVNFPARTVVLFNSDRYNGTEFVPLTATELHQMTGRAGRRGKDNIGFAVSVPGKFMDLRWIARLFNTPSSDVHSQIRINFSMALNLLLSHRPEQIKDLLEKSFASYLMPPRIVKKKRKRDRSYDGYSNYLWQDFLRHLEFLKGEGYVDANNALTDDGIWTSQLRIDQPLLVAEGFRLKLFPETDPVLLAALMAPFVSDREFEDERIFHTDVPKELLSLVLTTKKQLRPFGKRMRSAGFDTHPLYLQPAVTIQRWASGMDWEAVMKNADMAEGDLARLIFRTADNLRHICNLKETFPEAAETARQSIDLILKEPVVAFF